MTAKGYDVLLLLRIAAICIRLRRRDLLAPTREADLSTALNFKTSGPSDASSALQLPAPRSASCACEDRQESAMLHCYTARSFAPPRELPWQSLPCRPAFGRGLTEDVRIPDARTTSPLQIRPRCTAGSSIVAWTESSTDSTFNDSGDSARVASDCSRCTSSGASVAFATCSF